MKKLKLFSVGIAMLISYLTFGQEKTISGTVSDHYGLLSGASITVSGTPSKNLTDSNGKYSIKANKGAVLIFSFIGYESKSIIVESKTIIDVILVENSKILNEVVIVNTLGIKREFDSNSNYPKLAECKAIKNGYLIAPKKDFDNSNVNDYNDKIWNTNSDSLDKESYDSFIENPFESPRLSPLSTFSIDVDNASYTNIRRFINNGQIVPKDAVRVEEMINFFKYNYPQPKGEHPFSITTEYSDCPWNSENKLVRIGLQGKIIPTDNLPVSNLVFLIDVSGSMSDANKLPLLKESLKILVNQLRNEDKISIVVYAGAAGLVLPSTSGKEKKIIFDALDKLESGGSTAGGAGIELAYKIAKENFIEKGNNRVILATDGDFNVGSFSNSDMQKLIEEKRETGVFLTCLGYGMGNYKDSRMEILANKGNGNYAYIDTIQEANRFLGKEFKGSMFTIAKDVKIQIEFNPLHVKAYRLIGYENRKLRNEDFANDKIDAGDLGSGHTVTALYEIIPNGTKGNFYVESNDLKYNVLNDSLPKNYNEELATIKFRYKKPNGTKSIEMVSIIDNKAISFEETSQDYKFCTSVAWFGLILRDSKLLQNKSQEQVQELATRGISNDSNGYKAEFIRLMENARL